MENDICNRCKAPIRREHTGDPWVNIRTSEPWCQESGQRHQRFIDEPAIVDTGYRAIVDTLDWLGQLYRDML